MQIIARPQLSQGFDWLTVTTLVVTCLDLVMMVVNSALWNLLDSEEKKSQFSKEECMGGYVGVGGGEKPTDQSLGGGGAKKAEVEEEKEVGVQELPEEEKEKEKDDERQAGIGN